MAEKHNKMVNFHVWTRTIRG